MKKYLFLGSLLALSAFAFVPSQAQAQICDTGSQCGWIDVSNVTSYGVTPSASAQGFYNTQETKDRLCVIAGYERHPGYAANTQQRSWDNCNAEYHVDWRGYWDSHKCGGTSYLSSIYCARTLPAPTVPPPTVDVWVNPSVVSWGDRTTITWASQNASSCQASGDWSGTKAASGSEQSGTFLFGGKSFTLICAGANGESASDTANASIDIIPSRPVVGWQYTPSGSVNSGTDYRIEVSASDPDNDLASIYIARDGVVISTSGAGTTMAAYTANDVGPKTVVYTAWAKDSGDRTANVISRSITISAPPVVQANAPSIRWISSPLDVASDATYRIEAEATDADRDLATVNINKNRVAFAYAGAGNGTTGSSGNSSSDTGPQRITFNAWATDRVGNRSPDIEHMVYVAAPTQAIQATVSVTSNCVAPGGTINVSGNASGSGITSNVLEKDSNKDGSYGSIASRSDAGATSASVSVPAGETSDRYDFRVSVNGGQNQSSVASVRISSSCGGQSQGGLCALFPWMCGNNNPPASPSVPISSSASPSVSISSSASCVAPNTNVTITSTAGGSPINSNVIQKDSPASDSQYGDGQFGTVADFGSSGGSHSYSAGIGSEGYYDFKALVNGSVSATTRVRSLASCTGGPGVTGNPGNTGNTGNSGNNNGGGPVASPPVRGCTDPSAFNYNPRAAVNDGSCVYPSFSLGAQPNPVKVKSVAGYSASTDEDILIYVTPAYGFSAPVQIVADPSSLPASLAPEYSFGGSAFTSNPSGILSLASGDSYFRNNGIIHLPIKVRFKGVLDRNASYSIRFTGRPMPGGRGSTAAPVTITVGLDSRPLYPDFEER